MPSIGNGIGVPFLKGGGGAPAPNPDFTMLVKTDNAGTSASDQFTIPTTGGGYNYDVDWGDGTTSTGVTGSTTHTFPSAGNYVVKISGAFPRIYFNNGGDRLKLLEVQNWGNIAWTSMERAFFGCSNMDVTATDVPDLSSVTNMFAMFNSASSFNQDIGSWDVGNVTSMRDMFLFATAFNQDIGSWNVGNVVDMWSMFRLASNFDQDLSSWDIGKVSQFGNFLWQATGLSTTNYDATLIGWESTLQAAYPIGVGYPYTINIHFGGSQYTAGGAADTARTSLISIFGWTITDGGSV